MASLPRVLTPGSPSLQTTLQPTLASTHDTDIGLFAARRKGIFLFPSEIGSRYPEKAGHQDTDIIPRPGLGFNHSPT